ncbi:sigma 54-interacting transcriptional regulator [candidate division KSB1 bacterium]|nr:sigma 54-interacting transcriptional regulator [candidate division KSB1 bacterium]MBL7092471.1 sigma 54-interacting transcriptional regulator [candidate division KSB1 bacterium]
MQDQLLRLAKRVLAETEVSSVLAVAMDQLVEISKAERGMIILFDKLGNGIFETARNLDKKDVKNPEFEVSRTIIDKVKTNRRPLCFRNALEEPLIQKSKSVIRLQILSVMCLPLAHEGDFFGVVYLDNRTMRGIFTPQIFDIVGSFADFISMSAHNALKLKGKEQRILGLESDLRSKYQFNEIISHNPKMMKILKLVSQVANSEAIITIHGESGTGKELIARAIHFNSSRSSKPFIPINCGALPESLLESEFFGHVKGAFTGAINGKAGWFETAKGGTIFLDEVGEMTSALQVKLLRVLQTGEYSRVGSREIQQADVRVLTATNQNLLEHVNEGKFRNDLYYRLNVIDIELPPLRERKDDILVLAKHFINIYGKKCKKNNLRLSREAEACLLAFDYPGNIRELENAVQRSVTLAEENVITPQHLPASMVQNRRVLGTSKEFSSLTEAKRSAAEQAEREFVIDCLRAVKGGVRKAAKMAGIDASNFHKIMKKHEIDATSFKT